MFNKFNIYFENKSTSIISITSFVAVCIIGLFDFYTGYELSFSIFYLLPVSAAVWYNGKKTGVIVSAISAVVWFFVDHYSGHIYSMAVIPLWNGFVRLGFFILITILLAEIKIRLQNETRLARLDNLTGLMNAHYFKSSTQTQMDIALRYNHNIVFGYIDLDNFKSVNDTMGHSAGDRVLKDVGRVLKDTLRTSDLAGRLGGDEFAVFLPETNNEGAVLVFTKVRQKLLEMVKANGWPIGFSMGVAIFQNIPKDPDAALKFADGLMYKVKKGGKNNILYEEFPGE